jgi:eukaryotic-like serine/threonine-protein kinase
MALSAGTRLGPYEIVALIGAGGMGEVYRARDSRLGRDVAIKVLPTDFSADAGRLQRLEQEARAAAALNHPNILAVYDVGADAGRPFIVSELLEGETLRDRLTSGPVGVRKAVAYALQIAHGLAAAHAKDITHRDLKPENVFVTRDNHVKILDFGLAKLTPDVAAAGTASMMATASPATEPGVVLGTAGYMAPEQVRAQAVDQRADLFAFGAILYELLSGCRAFRRETTPDTMAAILNDEPPDLRAAAPPIPPVVARIVERCLEKNPAARFQSASDLAFALDGVIDASSDSSTTHAVGAPRTRDRRGWLGWAAAGVAVAALAPTAYRHVREPQPAREAMRFEIAPKVQFGGPGNFAVSPDGRRLTFVGRGPDGVSRLWVKTMDSLDTRELPGTEVGDPSPAPFWSPDSRFVAFYAGGKLKKLDVSGGLLQTLCDLPTLAVGGSWNRNGDIIVGNISGGILRVPETGGTASPVTALDPSRQEEFHLLPSFLPDGRHFVYLRVAPGTPDHGGAYVGAIDARPEAQSTTRLMPYVVGLTYAGGEDSEPGRLLFLREGTLIAQRFDAARLALAGEAAPLAARVGSFRDGGFFSASNNGVLVYRTADGDTQVGWYDRQGIAIGRLSETGGFREAALSPDGTRVVVSRLEPNDAAKSDLWLLDASGRSGATRLTLGAGTAEFPVWSSDGKRIFFTLNNSRLRRRLASGEGDEEDILRSSTSGIIRANDSSPDGRFLLYTTVDALRDTVWDLWIFDRTAPKPVPFARTPFVEDQGRFSPDGRSVAFVSTQSGQSEIYVRKLASDFSGGSAATGGAALVSRGGGTAPRWRRDGRELFYLAPDGRMMAVEVTAGQEFSSAAPVSLFQTASGTIVGDVSADGMRFLLTTPAGPTGSAPFIVVLNWTTVLKP